MKSLLTLTFVATCILGLTSSGMSQDVEIAVGSQGVRLGSSDQFDYYGSDSYGRRLNRYQNNFGYNNNRHYHGHRQYGNIGRHGYRDYDYYGGNYGRVRDYRGYYRSNPYRGYNGYYSRPGFSIGGGSSRVFFNF